jgi:outer membrane protein assembly factor BamA
MAPTIKTKTSAPATTATNSELSQDNIGGDFFRSALAVNYIYDSRDSSILPRSGHKVDIGLTYAGLGGDVDTFTSRPRPEILEPEVGLDLSP